jgi:hypothetical protein
MKTLTVVLTVLLGVMSFQSKSMNQISFSVQVAVKHQFSPQKLNLLAHPVDPKKGDTIQLEKHTDYLRAMKDKQVVTQNTMNEAWIVAFFLGKKVSLDDAFSIMNNYNEYDASVTMSLPAPPNDFYYAIEVLTNEDQSLLDYIKQCPELEKQISQKDENIFTIGKITSHAKALAFQDKLISAGLKNCVVVAYEGTKQVPVYIIGR